VAVGYGEGRPLASGEDEVSNARNRRVEFVVEQWRNDGGQ
jgi:outer membrane protein OmpA-like peptidoglycan-associated protein